MSGEEHCTTSTQQQPLVFMQTAPRASSSSAFYLYGNIHCATTIAVTGVTKVTGTRVSWDENTDSLVFNDDGLYTMVLWVEGVPSLDVVLTDTTVSPTPFTILSGINVASSNVPFHTTINLANKGSKLQFLPKSFILPNNRYIYVYIQRHSYSNS
jgi:hypothetical protein